MNTSVTPITPAPHVSWLKRFGQEVVKVIGFIAKDAVSIEKVAVPVAETLLPMFAPEINLAAGIFDKIAGLAQINEAAFAAVGQASNGPAKLNSVLTAVNQDLDAWVADHFPGAGAIQKGEAYIASKTDLVNAVVKFLNGVDASAANVKPTATAIAAASAAKAAVSALQPAAA